MQGAPQFDIAVSYASEDRQFASDLASALRLSGLTVFFDLFHESDLVGQFLPEYLVETYKSRARYCVMLLSAAYVSKGYTRLESRAAQVRQLTSAEQYIIPLKLDDSETPSLLQGYGYVDVTSRTLDEVCQIIVSKARTGSASPTSASGNSPPSRVHDVDVQAMHRYVGLAYENLGYGVQYDVRIGTSYIPLIASRELPSFGAQRLAVFCEHRSDGLPAGRRDVNSCISTVENVATTLTIDTVVVVSSSGFADGLTVETSGTRVALLTIADLEDQLLDVTSALRKHISDYERSDIFNNYVPVAGALSPLFSSDEVTVAEDLAAAITELFSQGTTFVSVLGDFGGGKTTLLDRLKYECSLRYCDRSSRTIPILFLLKDSHRYPDLQVLVARTLQREFGRDIPADLFWRRVDAGDFLVLLDGFDEMIPHSDRDARAEQFNHLMRFFRSASPVVLTCRPSYFVTEDEYLQSIAKVALSHEQIAPRRRLTRSQTFGEGLKSSLKVRQLLSQRFLNPEPSQLDRSLAATAEVTPFSDEKIENFLLRHDETIRNHTGGRHDAYSLKALLNEIYDLKDLMSRPILLDMILVTVLSGHIDLQDPGLSLGPTTLYEINTDMQFDRDWQKGDSRQKLLSKEERREFSECLALAMFDSGSLSIKYDDIVDLVRYRRGSEDGLLRHLESVSDEAIATDVQICSFLSRGPDGLFHFVHKSFMEYFVARCLREVLATSANDPRWNRPLSQEILYFLSGFAYVDASFIDDVHRLHRRASRSGEQTGAYLENISAVALMSARPTRPVRLRSGQARGLLLSKLRFDKAELVGWVFTETRVQKVRLAQCSVGGSVLVGCELQDLEILGGSWSSQLDRTDVAGLRANDTAITISGSEVVIADALFESSEVDLDGQVLLQKSTMRGGRLYLRGLATASALKAEGVRIELSGKASLDNASLENCEIVIKPNASLEACALNDCRVLVSEDADEFNARGTTFNRCTVQAAPGTRVSTGPHARALLRECVVSGIRADLRHTSEVGPKLEDCSGYVVVEASESVATGRSVRPWEVTLSDSGLPMVTVPWSDTSPAPVFYRLDAWTGTRQSATRLASALAPVCRDLVERSVRTALDRLVGAVALERYTRVLVRRFMEDARSSSFARLGRSEPLTENLDDGTYSELVALRPSANIELVEFAHFLRAFMGSAQIERYQAVVGAKSTRTSALGADVRSELERMGLPREVTARLGGASRSSASRTVAEVLLSTVGDDALESIYKVVARQSEDGVHARIVPELISSVEACTPSYSVVVRELIARFEIALEIQVRDILSRNLGEHFIARCASLAVSAYEQASASRRSFRLTADLRQRLASLGLSGAALHALEQLNFALLVDRARLASELEAVLSASGQDTVPDLIERHRVRVWDELAMALAEQFGDDSLVRVLQGGLAAPYPSM